MSAQMPVPDCSMKADDLAVLSTNPWSGGLLDPKTVLQASDTDLVELAQQIEVADKFTHANAVNKLNVILEQIRHLQQKAKEVLVESQQNSVLHHIACNFKKVPGHTYYLYERSTGQHYFSMVSPQEWGSSCPSKYVGCYRLEHDLSWTPHEKLCERSGQYDLINKLLSANKGAGDNFALSLGITVPALELNREEQSSVN